MVVQTREELQGAIAEMLAHNGPVVMDVRVTKDENCYPMVAPGKSNAQMIGLPIQQPKVVVEPVSCSHCGTTNSPNHNFCSECGTKL
jgi:acetolactate synthase I/II/III large subunit